MRHLAIRPTKAHVITSVRGYIWEGGGFASIVHHPGNASHPWVAAGVAAGREAAINAAAGGIFAAIRKDSVSGVALPDTSSWD